MTLQTFGGRDVDEVALRIVGAGDGLSDAMAIAPVELEHDDLIHVVLACRVTKITYEEIKDSEALRRVHVARASSGTLLNGEAARTIMDEHRRQVEEARGVTRLPGT